jgi:hypothetical protein
MEGGVSKVESRGLKKVVNTPRMCVLAAGSHELRAGNGFSAEYILLVGN